MHVFRFPLPTSHFPLFLAFLIAAPLAAAETGERPNVLMILVDDLGYGDLSSYGGPNLQTPQIDSLAVEGMRFTRFRANSNVCSPSRAALLSGMYPDRAGVPGVIRTHANDSWGNLSPDLTLLPAVLEKHGYETAIIGKWHLGLSSPNTPNERGFGRFRGFLGDMMDDYHTHLRHGENYMRSDAEMIDPKGHATDLFSDWACEYLRERAGQREQKPFFLYLAYNAPHVPIQPPPEFLERVLKREPGIDADRAKLVALIEHLDGGIGRVLQALRETGFEQNTLVMFSSDNGGQCNVGAFNGPHRGTKGEMYEGGLKVPFLAKWAGRITPGSRCEAEGVLMDVFPTVLDAAGIPVDERGRSPDGSFVQRIDGRSLGELFSGKAATLPPRTLYFVRREGGTGFGGKTSDALIEGDWKILQNTPVSPPELYNLRDDPLEEHDLRKTSAPEFRDRLYRLMLQIQEGGQVPWQPKGRESLKNN